MTDNEMDAGTDSRAGYGHHILPALLVVAMGLIFLVLNLGVRIPFLDSANWWAWFILAGAVWPLSEAWTRYRAVGRLDAALAHSLLNALGIVIVAGIFILGLSWATWWPVFVIYGGLCMLVRDPQRERRRRARNG
ncbi:MAG: hypothetical protein RSP_20690 [Rhodanobacter sp.]